MTAALRVVAGLVAALALSLLLAAPASAHAALVSTDPVDGAVLPSAPDSVTLTFNEPVVLPANGVEVHDATGADVVTTARIADTLVEVDLPEGLGLGSYLLTWRVVSADGHPLAGSLSFSVGQPSTGIEAPETSSDSAATARLRSGIQGLQYVGLLLATGLVVFAGWVLPRPARAALPRRVRAVGIGAGVLAVLSAVALVPLSGAERLGAGIAGLGRAAAWDPGLVGTEWLALVLVTVGLAVALPALGGRRRSALFGAALALTGPSLVGHTRSVDPEILLVLVDLTHLVAGALWFGGLVGLALVLPSVSGRDGLGAQVLTRFSVVAASALVVLVAMGGLLSWRILGSWANLFHTDYGLVLLFKSGVVAAAVAVASINHYVLLPRVRAAAGRHDVRRAARLTRRAVLAEAALLVVALLATGFLTGQTPHDEAPPAAAPGGTVSRTVALDDVQVLARLTSDTAGPNSVEIELTDRAGRPVRTVDLPEVRLRSTEVDLGTLSVTRTGEGSWAAAVVLPGPGQWDVQVSVPLSRYERPVTTLALSVSG